VREDFDLAAREVRIHRAFGARPHEAGHADDEFVAQLFRDGEGRGAIGIADDLHQALAIAQIDENNAAVIAQSVHPASKRDRFANVAFAKLITLMRSRHEIRRNVSF